MRKGDNLRIAKSNKNDEFYTQYNDIIVELQNYSESFKNMVVYCNCDNPYESNFAKYFVRNFNVLGLKKLLISNYAINGNDALRTQINSVTGDVCTEDTYRSFIKEHTEVSNGNGSFDSPECIELLKEADIVVTNPPFSIFRSYVDLLTLYDKKFLIVGNQNAISYKNCFKLIKENKMWLGINMVKEFMIPDGTIKKFGNICWFTNLPNHKRNEFIDCWKSYNPVDYPKYDNYDAINCDKTSDIPGDYDGVIGVPITFMFKYNPKQFEIVGEANNGSDSEYDLCKAKINGEQRYKRILISIIK